MAAEFAFDDRSGCSRSLHEAGRSMAFRMGASHVAHSAIRTSKARHICNFSPTDPNRLLEPSRSSGTTTAYENGGGDRPEMGNEQTAHKSGFTGVCSGRFFGIFDILSSRQTLSAAVPARFFEFFALKTAHPAGGSLSPHSSNGTYLGRRH